MSRSVSTDAVAAMSFSVPPQSEEVRSALADHVIETNQLEYAAKFGTTADARRRASNFTSSTGSVSPSRDRVPPGDEHQIRVGNSRSASSSQPPPGFQDTSSGSYSHITPSIPHRDNLKKQAYPPNLRKYVDTIPAILRDHELYDEDGFEINQKPTTLRLLARTYEKKLVAAKKRSQAGGKGSKAKAGTGGDKNAGGGTDKDDESTALMSKEERERRRTVKLLKTDVGVMRSHLVNLKTLARHGQRYVNENSGELRIFHSQTSRKWIRSSERLYSEARLAHLEPLELKEYLKDKAEKGRYSEARATPYRGYETVKDVKGLASKLKSAGVRVVPAGETYLTNALKETYFYDPNSPQHNSAAMQMNNASSLKGFHQTLTVQQQPIEVYNYLNKTHDSLFPQQIGRSMEEDDEFDAALFEGEPHSPQARLDGERRWFAGSDGHSPRHWHGPKRSPLAKKTASQIKNVSEFSRYRTEKKKLAVQNPGVPREPPTRC